MEGIYAPSSSKMKMKGDELTHDLSMFSENMQFFSFFLLNHVLKFCY